MKSVKGCRFLFLILSAILITSVFTIFSPTGGFYADSNRALLHRDTFKLASTFAPGEYPEGLNLIDGDVLNAIGGGNYNVTGDFTIASGATVTITAGYKIVIYADNILIAGILDGNGAGWPGGPGGGGTMVNGIDGWCEPQSGAGKGGMNTGDGGGGAAYGNGGMSSFGGQGGVEFGYAGFASNVPSPIDIRLGGGGGGGARGSSSISLGGNGGCGGAGVYLKALDNIFVNGTIQCDGDSGGYGASGSIASGGGGGGAGGGILLFGDNVVVSGTLRARGGAGGNGGLGTAGGFGGGDASGGRIKIAYNTSLNTTGSSISVTGGGYSGTYWTYKPDYILPLIHLMNPSNSTHHKPNTTIVVNASDDRELQQVRYNWDGAANKILTPSGSPYIFSVFLPPSEGEHKLQVFAEDLSGNSNHKTYTFITDDTGPSIILDSPRNYTAYPSDTLVKLAITDSFSLNQTLYNWDSLGGNTSLPESFELLLPSAEGWHNLTIYASDFADNWNSKTFSFITDDTSPSCTRPADIVYIEGETGQSIGWTPSDANPGHYVITLDGYLVESGTWSSDMDVNISADGLTPGIYVYTLILYDIANNLITDTVIVTVLSLTTTTTVTSTISTSTTSTSSTIFQTTSKITSTTMPTTSEPDMGSPIILIMAIGLGITSLIVIVIFVFKRKS